MKRTIRDKLILKNWFLPTRQQQRVRYNEKNEDLTSTKKFPVHPDSIQWQQACVCNFFLISNEEIKFALWQSSECCQQQVPIVQSVMRPECWHSSSLSKKSAGWSLLHGGKSSVPESSSHPGKLDKSVHDQKVTSWHWRLRICQCVMRPNMGPWFGRLAKSSDK